MSCCVLWLFVLEATHIRFYFFCRIYVGAMRGPWDAAVRQEERLQFRHWRHVVLFLQYGLPPRGVARVDLSGRRAENVERPPAEMRWWVLGAFILKLSPVVNLDWCRSAYITTLWPQIFLFVINERKIRFEAHLHAEWTEVSCLLHDCEKSPTVSVHKHRRPVWGSSYIRNHF